MHVFLAIISVLAVMPKMLFRILANTRKGSRILGFRGNSRNDTNLPRHSGENRVACIFTLLVPTPSFQSFKWAIQTSATRFIESLHMHASGIRRGPKAEGREATGERGAIMQMG